MTKTQIGTATVTNGTASTTYTIPGDLSVGQHILYGTFTETSTHESATGQSTFTVRIATTTSISNVIASIGETVTFTANVKYNTNQNVNEGQVQFKMGETTIGTSNVTNGVATLDYVIPSNTSDGTTIKAIYVENNTYASSTSNDGTLSIREDTNVLLQNISGNRDSTIYITAEITDSDGDPVNTGTAQLYIDNVASGQAVSVVSGEAEFSYNIANNATLGSHTIKVTYNQNDRYETSDGTATLTVRTPTVTTAVDTSANKDSTVTLTVNVKDSNTQPVTSGTVNITIGTGSPVTCNVNSSGIATTTYNVPSNASGTIQFTAEYLENNTYEGSTTSTAGVITIRKGVTLSVSDVEAVIGESITLSSTLKDEDNNNVDGGTVTYEIE